MNIQSQIPFDCFSFIQSVKEKGIILSPNNDRIDIWGPKSALDAELATTLRENKFAILKFLESVGGKSTHAVKLHADVNARHEPFPLTDIQRAYWVGRQQAFDLGDVSIHFYTEVDCEMLDVERLQLAWNKTVAHHDMLRAVVNEKGSQTIRGQVPDYEIDIIDIADQSAESQAQTLQALRDELAQKVHNAEHWPSFDLKVVRLDETRSRLFFGQDLLHVDGGSLLIVLKDFSTWYLDPDFQKRLPEISYRDYALFEGSAKDTAQYALDLDYWRQQLQQMPPPPQLPARDAQGERPQFRRRTFSINSIEFQRLKAVAARLGITPTGFVMAAFSDIISCWNSSEDFALNVTLFNRPDAHPDLQTIVGDFTSMVLVPVQKVSGESLIERARRLQRTLWHHLDHRNVSGITILDELRKMAGSHDAAKYTVVFTSLLNLSGHGYSSDWLSAFGTHTYTVTQTPQVTIDHQIFEQSEGALAFSWDVIENVFPDGLINSMFGAYEALIRLLLQSDETWDSVSLCHTPLDHLTLFETSNDTSCDYPEDETLRSMFMHAAQSYPDRIAVCDDRLELTYAELGNIADKLAGTLLAKDISRQDKVLVFMDKGWGQVAAVLGIHGSGAAYVPVDTTSPAKRIAHIVADCQARVVMLDRRSASLWPHGVLIDQIIIDEALLSVQSSGENRQAGPRADDVSHVIYTSGSTGQPKGVVIEHRNVVNRIVDINTRFEIGPHDAILGLTALHHDLSVYDIFGVLSAGGTLVLPDADKRLDPSHWARLMRQRRVTLWNSVPAFASMLTDYLSEYEQRPDDIPLRWMILAGDWIPVVLPSKARQHWPTIDFIASGGPTETTIWDIWNRVSEVDPSWSSIPYGRPLANAQYFVLDKQRNQCPVWVSGELYISGAGVTREYLNAPEISAGKYVDHPGLQQRLFKSGDMGRFLPSGQIEFLGRNDFQVKIHGQRIELAEIEKVALSEGGLDSCLALVKETQNGPTLALFAVPKAGHQAQDSENIQRQQEEFLQLKVGIADPVERLVHKLEYRALVPAARCDLIKLPDLDTGMPVTRSHRIFKSGPMSVDDLSRFLAPLRARREGADGEAKLNYGSGGGVYPVQVYLDVKRDAVAGLEGGVYRFHPLGHQLSLISPATLPNHAHWSYNRTMASLAPLQLFVCADMEVMQAQYGPVAQAMSYLEAGMLSQCLRQAAPLTGFGVCQVGFVDLELLNPLLQLRPSQLMLTALVAGQIPETAGHERITPSDMTAALKAVLAEHLPPHMVPSHIITLPALPLTPNGKIDRKKLLVMDLGASDAPRRHVAPAVGFEQTVAAILGEIIGAAQIGVTENFFDLGANSALLVRAYNRILSETGLDFPLINLFRFPTIRSLNESLVEQPQQRARPAEDKRVLRLKSSLRNLRSARGK